MFRPVLAFYFIHLKLSVSIGSCDKSQPLFPQAPGLGFLWLSLSDRIGVNSSRSLSSPGPPTGCLSGPYTHVSQRSMSPPKTYEPSSLPPKPQIQIWKIICSNGLLYPKRIEQTTSCSQEANGCSFSQLQSKSFRWGRGATCILCCKSIPGQGKTTPTQ